MPDTTMPTETIVVATDGGCIGNRGADPAGWAWYVDEHSHAFGHLPASTNNIAELTAIHRAIEMLPDEADLLIRADSQYAMKCLTGKALGGWVDGWMARGWKKAGGQPVSNREVIQPAYEAIQAKAGRVVFEWVKGHNGDPLNEAVDALANTAARNPSVGVLAGPGWSGIDPESAAAPEVPAVVADLLGDPGELGRALQAVRVARGMSVSAVAEAMGTSVGAVENVEDGAGDPYLSDFQRYARAVGARLDIRVTGG